MRYNEFESIRFLHEEIREALFQAVKEGGKIGSAAKSVVKVAEAHFTKEEEIVFPLLGLLQPAQENTDKNMQFSLDLIEKMQDSLVVLHNESKKVVSASITFIKAAKDEKKPKYLRLAARLLLHERAEKEIIYPTAILIGNYLKLKMAV